MRRKAELVLNLLVAIPGRCLAPLIGQPGVELRVSDTPDAHDIHRIDDTMLVVWNRAGSYNGASKVSTWIFAIAYRKALTALRRRDEPVEDTHAESRPSFEADPEEALERRQGRDALLKAMAGLSANHRAVVDLTYFQELGYREIAEIMACPPDTVKTRMFHARRHLKRELAGRLTDWL